MPDFAFWLLKIILLVIFMVGIFCLMTRYRRVMLKICPWLAGFSVIAGFSLYSYSNFSSGMELANIPLTVLRGIIYTVRIFLINADYEVLGSRADTQNLMNSIWMQIIFWLCHVSALIVVQIALISLVGRKLVDHLRLCAGFYREIYFIKGSDKNALLLGENIAINDNPRQGTVPERLVVFLLEEDDDEKNIYEKASRFGGIVKVLDRNRGILYYLELAGLKKKKNQKRTGRERKYNIILMANNSGSPEDVKLVMTFAKETGLDRKDLGFFVFAASEWDRKRIERIIQANEKNQREYPYSIRIISEVDVASRQMIEKHPPFKCPGLDFSDGIAARDFTVMILGLGTVGQAALLHLVMNGQFAGSRMRAVIIDKNMDDLLGSFLHRHPALNMCCEIIPGKFDARSESFYDFLKTISYADYIVVALDSDEINRQTALDIRSYYTRMDINAIPFIAVSEKNGSPEEADENEKQTVFTFGSGAEIFRHEVIIREKSDRLAKAVNEVYGGPNWYEIDLFSQESSRASADFIPAMLELAGLKEDAVEDVLVKDNDALAEILAQTEHLRWNAFHAAMGWHSISIEEMNKYFADTKDVNLCRKNRAAEFHVCLAPWDQLDEISEAYGQITRKAEDFKEADRRIIENIPKFLRKAKEEGSQSS